MSRRNRRFLGRRFAHHPVYRGWSYGEAWLAFYQQATVDQLTWRQLLASPPVERDTRGIAIGLDSDWRRFGGAEWWRLEPAELARSRLVVEADADIRAGAPQERVRAWSISASLRVPSAETLRRYYNATPTKSATITQQPGTRADWPTWATPAPDGNRSTGLTGDEHRSSRRSNHSLRPSQRDDRTDYEDLARPPLWEPLLLIGGLIGVPVIAVWMIVFYAAGPVEFVLVPGRGFHISDLLVIAVTLPLWAVMWARFLQVWRRR